jgi:hypothetical protein
VQLDCRVATLLEGDDPTKSHHVRGFDKPRFNYLALKPQTRRFIQSCNNVEGLDARAACAFAEVIERRY